MDYKPLISDILNDGVDRMSFGELKKEAKRNLEKRYAKRVDVKAPYIIALMIAEGKVKTMCDDEKCNELFGEANHIPICDKCMIYPNKVVMQFTKDRDENMLYDFETGEPIPYNLR
jgi:hypothetical protein